MTSRKQTARLAGALYCVWGLVSGLSISLFPAAFVVRGDAAATASKITSSPLLYRFALFGDLMAFVAAILMVLTLYELLKDVDRGYARSMVVFIVVQVAMAFTIMLTQLAPLVLLNGADYWSAFDKHQLDALALGSLTLRGQAVLANSAYWGLWLMPLGALVYKSGFLPRIIGVCLIVAGCGYVVSNATHFLFPAYYSLVFNVVTAPAAALGEIGLVGWLLIKGTRTEPLADRPSDSAR